jgi:predicted enzyme related to lactoylglutathione lyase
MYKSSGEDLSVHPPNVRVMTIARFPSLVIDCPDAHALATFYGAMLDWELKAEDGWVDIRPADGSGCISFQAVADYQAPEWPGQERPQQMHVDVIVDDLDAGEAAVVELGATKAETQPGTTFRVFLDPAGHPFCLCLS